MNSSTQKTLITFVGAAALGYYLFSRQKIFNFQDKTVFITGGSRGLGLSIAWNLLNDGARVALVARDKEELVRAEQILLKSFPQAEIFLTVADVTDFHELDKSFRSVCDHFGSIDLLINNAGSILVGPFSSMEIEDFEAQMKLHLYAVIHGIKIALPHFKRNGGGRILNICSLGGKMGVPHMAPYDASKFALAGFAQGVHAELSTENVIMTTAFPTVMRTGSPIQAVFKGDHKREFRIFETLDNLPGLSMSADLAAKKVLHAVAKGQPEIVLSLVVKSRIILGTIFPNLVYGLMQIVSRLLPRENSLIRKTGADSTSRTTPTEDEIMYNQKPRHDANFNMGLAGNL